MCSRGVVVGFDETDTDVLLMVAVLAGEVGFVDMVLAGDEGLEVGVFVALWDKGVLLVVD